MQLGQSLLFSAMIVLAVSSVGHADVLELISGGKLSGTLDPESADDAPILQITLLTGAQVRIPASLVKEVVRRPLKFEEYESRARHVETTAEAHWEMAEWCRARNLDLQRDYHLERVLEYDPEHRQAHYGLGHTRRDGKWLTREEFDASKRAEGFVKFEGKWVPVEKLDQLQASSARSKAAVEWYRKVRVWLGWASGRDPRRQADGMANLKTIRDPDAIAALIQFLGKSEHADVRSLFIEIVSPMKSLAKVPPLAQLGIYEDVRTLRDRALASIPEEGSETAQAIFIRALKDKRNLIVRRAGAALGRMGEESAAPALMRALVTTHTYKVTVPVKSYGGTFGTDGSVGGNRVALPPDILAGLRTGVYNNVQTVPLLGAKGATKVVPVSVQQQNPEVLTTLRSLTKHDFGYNEKAWQRWWNVDRQQSKLAPDLP